MFQVIVNEDTTAAKLGPPIAVLSDALSLRLKHGICEAAGSVLDATVSRHRRTARAVHTPVVKPGEQIPNVWILQVALVFTLVRRVVHKVEQRAPLRAAVARLPHQKLRALQVVLRCGLPPPPLLLLLLRRPCLSVRYRLGEYPPELHFVREALVQQRLGGAAAEFRDAATVRELVRDVVEARKDVPPHQPRKLPILVREDVVALRKGPRQVRRQPVLIDL